ncbi:MAG: hypothetical protein Q9195_005554 [Heterodermia aff. obscurata]
MQLLAPFLLAVSAGALPQSSNPSPSETLAPTGTLANSTVPSTHQKRYEDLTLGNFDDPKCAGTHLGTKTTIERKQCIQYTPANKFIDVYWGQSEGQLRFYSSGDCDENNRIKKLDEKLVEKHTCLKVADFTKTVLSVKQHRQ